MSTRFCIECLTDYGRHTETCSKGIEQAKAEAELRAMLAEYRAASLPLEETQP